MSRRARFRERIEAAGRLHLDARFLALHLLGHPAYLPLTRLVFSTVAEGDATAQSSALSVYQLLAEPYRSGRDAASERVVECLTAMRDLELHPVTAGVAHRAAQVRARLGGRTEQAVQIATAVDAGADLLVTQGSGLRRVAAIEVLDLDHYRERESASAGTTPRGS